MRRCASRARSQGNLQGSSSSSASQESHGRPEAPHRPVRTPKEEPFMASYRHALPQMGGSVFLTDGGLETTLVFHEGLDLPCFAAFPLLADEAGRERLRRYFAPYLKTARERGVGFILDTVTWRANTDWGLKLGYSPEALERINGDAVAFCEALRGGGPSERSAIVINGVIG